MSHSNITVQEQLRVEENPRLLEIENLIKHVKSEINLLKKRFLDESNRQCLATDYWKD